MRWRPLIAVALLFGLGVACFVPTIDDPGFPLACDSEHSCVSGFACVDLDDAGVGTCKKIEQAPGADGGTGTDVGIDPNTPCAERGQPICDGLLHVQCTEKGKPRKVLADCSSEGACDPRFGCLAACDSDGGCDHVGYLCDDSVRRCVPSPACGYNALGGCADTERVCESGACILPPSAPARIGTGASQTSADLLCYTHPPAEETEPDGGWPTATMSGWVTSSANRPQARTIGYQIKWWLADEFYEGAPERGSGVVDSQQLPGIAVDGGVVDAGPGGYYTLQDVPVGPNLVVMTSGTGGVDTYHYLRLPSGGAPQASYTQAIVSWDREGWQLLAGSAQLAAGANRGNIDVVVSDCSANPQRILGATGAVSVATPARYTLAQQNVLAIDPAALSSGQTGRVFFFDVPAIPLDLVIGFDPPPNTVFVDRKIRTMPGAVVHLPLKPR